jgi:hypothetical protein
MKLMPVLWLDRELRYQKRRGNRNGEIVTKATELRDRISRLKLQMDVADRNRDENTDLVLKAFELLQTLEGNWLAFSCAKKRMILDIVGLNHRLDGTSLVLETRKPFAILAEGLLLKDGIPEGLPTVCIRPAAGYRILSETGVGGIPGWVAGGLLPTPSRFFPGHLLVFLEAGSEAATECIFPPQPGTR